MEVFGFGPRKEVLETGGKRELMRKPHGVIVIDGIEHAHTAQCCHCGCHFIMVRHSGKRRGWCTNCSQVTCGEQKCHECIPVEKKLEMIEAGKPLTL